MQHSIRRRNPQSPDWLECTPLSSRQRGSCHLPTRSFSYSFPNCCCCSVTKLCLILCDPVDCSTPGFPILHHLLNLLKLMSIESVMPSNYLVLCCPLLPCLQSFLALGSFPTSQFFASGSQSVGVSASASILLMNI